MAQHKTLFSLAEPVFGKKIKVDFNASDISSNGGLLLVRPSKDTWSLTKFCYNYLRRKMRYFASFRPNCYTCFHLL